MMAFVCIISKALNLTEEALMTTITMQTIYLTLLSNIM